ncbi:MAG TPA: FkbM family methyltransferase [Candidatus Saccharimonadales bacterium]|nr:FkbM family methyltransferase [Candidatus Saccharimonadales bacterium]
MSIPTAPGKTSFVLPPQSGWHRVARFLRRPLLHQYYSIALRIQAKAPGFRFPVRLPFGMWFWAGSDYVSAALIQGNFELAELAFAGRILGAGQTVLDIGAHHGVYTLLASRCVGPQGAVISFEPSPRENAALRKNLALNHCRNVRTEGLALGDQEGECVLHVVDKGETGCNSLRPPSSGGSSSPVRVPITTLDRWMADHSIAPIHFVKLDVEGGELGVLKGAEKLLTQRPRPIILAEVQDIRTEPWGYPAKEIITHLKEREYEWHTINQDGTLQRFELTGDTVDGNFVAWPGEIPKNL